MGHENLFLYALGEHVDQSALHCIQALFDRFFRDETGLTCTALHGQSEQNVCLAQTYLNIQDLYSSRTQLYRI